VRAYRFRLATVARIRALEESVARERLMVAQRDVRLAREAVGAAEAALGALRAPTGLSTMAALTWTGEQADRLAGTVRARRTAMAAAASRCVEARLAWDVASKRSGALERLDAQRFARWRDETARQEATELDDLSHARYAPSGERS
jgi:flagellar export protein FliJ